MDVSQIKTSIKSQNTTNVQDEDFSVKLSDENSTPLLNKQVGFAFNNSTDAGEIINVDTEKYLVSSEDYVLFENQTNSSIVQPSTSQIKASDYEAYVGIKNQYTITLTADNVPLEGKEIVFTINNKTFTEKTDSKGKASINIDESKGSYTLSYYYAGDSNILPTNGSVTIKVKSGMPTKISNAGSKVFRIKKTGKFKIKLTDSRGNVLTSKKVTFKVNGKKYTKKTNSKGIAIIKIKLKFGSYKVKVSFSKTSVYNKASKTFTIKVKPAQARNNGMWLFGKDMKKVNLNKLQKYGFKHILLNFKALELHGKSTVEKWIRDAKSHGIKVHLWMQVFYENGKWKNPVKNGKINYNLIKAKVKEAKKYAKVKGVGGVHFDYVRYPGNAYNYNHAVKAVNTFIKKATKTVHKVNKKIIVSAAVMPEPSSMKHYYGQDIPTMGKYLDAIVPMVYKGNYKAGTKWIKFVTKTFKKQSKKAQIWTGLQSYKSDSKLAKLSAKELMGDADASALAGANGIILFRYGLFNYINFNEV